MEYSNFLFLVKYMDFKLIVGKALHIHRPLPYADIFWPFVVILMGCTYLSALLTLESGFSYLRVGICHTFIMINQESIHHLNCTRLSLLLCHPNSVCKAGFEQSYDATIQRAWELIQLTAALFLTESFGD